ncbi:MAG: 23S rRNA (pseudouridine(1915)-N(3))-methyltransferase RlmH [Deltaproteobacteria bacterium]|nr:23S rRNA (pseudouridine(1915)-N(3))-methyltransferase RlmH [Candidatus Anaeroferrophillus wilburensis]MBN2889240.1 23S rRNA (pseudouridine(1915)-N(3))-methyltransferase RlmH [Deltaproteobacteria bacterium]
MQLKFLFVGKTKQFRWQQEIDDYLGRLGRYAPVQLQELKEGHLGSKEEPRLFCQRQAPKLVQALNRDNFFRVVLAEQGKTSTTSQLAAQLERWLLSGRRGIVFLVGGPFGMAPAVKDEADYLLSLSPLTFTHDMARLILLEQLYRAMTIIKGEPYHY